MNRDALRPCPFCGLGGSIVDVEFDDVCQRWRVYCGRCGCSTGTSPRDTTQAPAITAWNTRAQPITGLNRDALLALADRVADLCVAWGDMEESDKLEDIVNELRTLAAQPDVQSEQATESDKDIALAQAVEFAEYAEGAAKGAMVERARHFLSLPYAQELATRITPPKDET